MNFICSEFGILIIFQPKLQRRCTVPSSRRPGLWYDGMMFINQYLPARLICWKAGRISDVIINWRGLCRDQLNYQWKSKCWLWCWSSRFLYHVQRVWKRNEDWSGKCIKKIFIHSGNRIWKSGKYLHHFLIFKSDSFFFCFLCFLFIIEVQLFSSRFIS